MKTLTNLKALIIATIINDGGSNTFASFIGLVEQKMNKTGNPLFGKVTRLGKYNVTLNGNYTNAMAKATNDPDFKAKPAWFTRVLDGINGSIVSKNSDPSCFYLAFMLENYQFIGYYVDGRPASVGEVQIIEQFKAKSSHNEVGFACIGIDNIKQLNAKGLQVAWE